MSDYFGLEAERRERDGLYGKYEVLDLGGYPVVDAFVLRPERDVTALAALIHYANLTPNQELADDLNRWIQQMEDADG